MLSSSSVQSRIVYRYLEENQPSTFKALADIDRNIAEHLQSMEPLQRQRLQIIRMHETIAIAAQASKSAPAPTNPDADLIAVEQRIKLPEGAKSIPPAFATPAK